MKINNSITIEGVVFEKMIDTLHLRKIVQNLSQNLTKELSDTAPIFLCVLKGAYIFMSDLSRMLPFPHEVEFVKLTSYNGLDNSNGVELATPWPPASFKNKVVVIIEDVVDTGNTIEFLVDLIQKEEPQKVEVCTLFLKPKVYQKNIPIEYVGKTISNEFIVGYGLDFNQSGRGLPEIYQKVNS